MTAVAVKERLQYEAGVRNRQAAIAVGAGVLLVGATVVLATGPQTSVSEETLGLIYAHKRLARDLAGGVIDAIGWTACAITLYYLFGATRARNQQQQAFTPWLAVVGAPLVAVGILGQIIVTGIQADKFVTHGLRTWPEAHVLVSPIWVTGWQLLLLLGYLLMAIAFVLISMNAMRVGLLTRFMGYLGMVAGALVIIPFFPAPVVQCYWLIAVGVLIAGRWPTGAPPAWSTGRAERLPSAQELRQQRVAAGEVGPRRRGKAEPPAEPEPVTPPVRTRATTPKRKRKHRK